MKGYKVERKTASGDRYETDSIIETKKKAEIIADQIFNRMNGIECAGGQGAWVVKL